jgi:hypothetical protein
MRISDVVKSYLGLLCRRQARRHQEDGRQPR